MDLHHSWHGSSWKCTSRHVLAQKFVWGSNTYRDHMHLYIIRLHFVKTEKNKISWGMWREWWQGLSNVNNAPSPHSYWKVSTYSYHSPAAAPSAKGTDRINLLLGHSFNHRQTRKNSSPAQLGLPQADLVCSLTAFIAGLSVPLTAFLYCFFKA